MYIYIESTPGVFTVGHYKPSGDWVPESDHLSRAKAVEQVSFLNGSQFSGVFEKMKKLIIENFELQKKCDLLSKMVSNLETEKK